MIPMEAVEAAGDVLVYHQRKDIRGCTCGWAEPGRSYPEHQARLALEAAAPYMLAAEYRRGYRDGLTDRKQVTAEPRAWEPGDPIE